MERERERGAEWREDVEADLSSFRPRPSCWFGSFLQKAPSTVATTKSVASTKSR